MFTIFNNPIQIATMPKNATIIKLTNFFDPTGQTTQIYEGAYDFGEKHLAPYNRELVHRPTNEIGHPVHIWKEMAKEGWLGVGAKVKYGGSDASFLKQMVITHAFSYHCPSIGLSYLAHDDLGLGRILEWGTEAQIEEYAKYGIIEGEAMALAMSEPEAGSDVMSMKSHAVQDGDYFILNGLKTWITNGASAKVVVTYFKSAEDKITTFIIPKGTPGFSVLRKIGKNGMRGSETAELSFNDCRVHKNQILGPLHGGKKVLGKGLNTEREKLCIAGIAIGDYGFDKVCEYAQTREQFDAPIAVQQSLAFDIANMGSELETMTKSCLLAAHMHDNGIELTRTTAASDFLQLGKKLPPIMLKCVEIFGGNGLTDDYELISQYRNDSDLSMTGGGSIKMREEILARDYLPEYDQEQEAIRAWRKERREKAKIVIS